MVTITAQTEYKGVRPRACSSPTKNSPSSGSSPATGHGTREGQMLQAQPRLCRLTQPPPGTGAAHPKKSDIRKRNLLSPGQTRI